MANKNTSIYEELERIPCFKKTFTFGIWTGIGVGLASFIFTSRVKRSADIAVGSFAVATIVKWIHCRHQWTKEHFLQHKMERTLHEIMLKEGNVESSEPSKSEFTSV